MSWSYKRMGGLLIDENDSALVSIFDDTSFFSQKKNSVSDDDDIKQERYMPYGYFAYIMQYGV